MTEAVQRLSKESIVQDYKEVFSGTGCLEGEYEIILDSSIPAVQNRPRRIPLTMKAAVEEKLKAMERDGWIAKVESPTEWISNMTAVWKADKAQVRGMSGPPGPEHGNTKKSFSDAYIGRHTADPEGSQGVQLIRCKGWIHACSAE